MEFSKAPQAISFLCLWLSALFLTARGEWDDPPLEAGPDALEGINFDFVNGQTSINILENVGGNLNGGFALARLRFKGTETHQPTIRSQDNRFSLVEITNQGQPFWCLNVTGPFDYENPIDLSIPFLTLEINTPTDKDRYVLIKVEDENDNSPIVRSQDPSSIDPIPEFEIPNNYVVKIFATDDDVADNDKLLFDLEEDGNDASSFEIHQNGEVHLKTPLNYLIRTSHRLNIKITDPRAPFYNATTSVTVLVKDIPNIPPEFTTPPIIRAVNEETDVDTIIFDAVQARDGDYGLNWPIEYFLVDDNVDNQDDALFKIDQTTGQIKVKNRIDADEDEKLKDLSYSFTVIARENYDESDYPNLPPEETERSVVVTFPIADINDQPPKICTEESQDIRTCEKQVHYTFEIFEDHNEPIQLDGNRFIRVKDLDSTPYFNRFEAHFADNTEEIIRKAFRISPTQGMDEETFFILVNDVQGIDFENDAWHDDLGNPRPKSFTIEFTGTNNSEHKAIATFDVLVKDVNDNRPIFELPVGQVQYEFTVCENVADGTVLHNFIVPPDAEFKNSCVSAEEENEIQISAIDRDISPEFGQPSIIYRWSATTRKPPIKLGEKDGLMTMELGNDNNGFDYERFTEEIFIVEAIDKNAEEDGLVATVSIRFKILDRNDEPVDLKFMQGYRPTVIEEDENERRKPVLEGIIASDVDENADIFYSMTVNSLYTKANALKHSTSGEGASLQFPEYKLILENECETLREKKEKWFVLKEVDGSTSKYKTFEILLGEDLPDREGYGCEEVDRVDLTITVDDNNQETGDQHASQVVTVTIQDRNDNPPVYAEEDTDNFTVNVLETEWGDEGDSSSDYQREIFTLRVKDADRDTTFEFSLSNDDCEFEAEVCEEIYNMFEISHIVSRTGTTILRRKKDQIIDRENRKYFQGDSDILNITVVTSDGVNTLPTKFQVHVDDRNDNTPQFVIDYTVEEYWVDEIIATPELIVNITATDADHPNAFGKVSYLFTDGGNSNGNDKFDISLDLGEITAIPGAYDWSVDDVYVLEVKAIDYYRESSSSGSNANTTYVTIKVKDKNNHNPEFLTDGGSSEDPFMVVGETQPKKDQVLASIRIQDMDNPDLDNGDISVVIQDVVKQPPTEDPTLNDWFKLELTPEDGSKHVKELAIIPTKDLQGFWGNYTIKLKASDGVNSDPSQLSTEASYFLWIQNENKNSPEFTYPETNDTTVLISIEDSEPNEVLIDLTTNEAVPEIHAEDKDEGSEGGNGIVTYSINTQGSNPECVDYFQINPDSGIITLTQKMDEKTHANKDCSIILKASDNGPFPNSDFRKLKFIPLVNKNTPPRFPDPEIQTSILENSTESITSRPFDPATDVDIENGNIYFNDTIYYFLKGGDSHLFDLVVPDEDDEDTQLRLKVKSGEIIDRETVAIHYVSIYCTNDPADNEREEDRDPEEVLQEPDDQWAVLNVVVEDQKDTAPEFSGLEKGFISTGISPSKKTGDKIGSVEVVDPDCDDIVKINITSDFDTSDPSLPNNTQTPPFKVEFDDESVRSNQEPNCPSKSMWKIVVNFDTQPYYKGYFKFQLTAEDSVGYISRAECRIYVVSSNNVLNFYFINDQDFLIENQPRLSDILSDAFQSKCNIDRVFNTAAAADETVVETHFINTTNDKPLVSEYIKAQQFKPVFYNNLTDMLAKEKFRLSKIGESDPKPDSNIGQIMTFVLIGGVAVLTISLLILAATCYYNNKGLHRRVRALTANTFGSQQSDLNRLGVAMDAPNTNAFAVEGSNPIWTTDTSDPRKIPDFDTDSVGSGGSVLIGAEDEDYFQKSSKNPMFQVDDVVANYDSDNDVSDRRSPYNNDVDSGSYNAYNGEATDSPFTSKMTKNPLMNLGDARMSIDVDDVDGFGDEAYQFEGNTDVALF